MIGRIIYLEPDDDLAGIRDRIEWAQANRIALVLSPDKRARRFTEVDFGLLRRTGEQYGCEIAVVSPSWRQRRIAREVGLAAFSGSEQAIRRRWLQNDEVAPFERRTPLRRFSPNSLRVLFPKRNWFLIGLRVVIVLATVIIVAAGGLVVLPTASITLTASSQDISLIVPVTLDPQIDKVDVKARTVPAQRVDVVVEDTGAAPTTGAKDIPRGKARGSVTLFNALPIPYTVPHNTVMRTSSASVAVRFVTLNDVAVPPGGRANVGVQAIDEGPSGNVPANQINRVEGLPALAVRVLNTAPTRGGGIDTVRAVTLDDYKRARAALLDKLLQSALDKMRQDPEVARNGWYIVPNTLFIADVQDETYDRFVTEQADEVKLTMRLQVAGYAVAPADLDTVARTVLLDKVPQGFSLLDAFTERGDVSEEGTGMRTEFFIVAHGTAGAQIDENLVKKIVRGKSIPDAQSALLQALALKGNPSIDVEPKWLLHYTNRLPFVTLRIQTQVKRE